MMPMQGVKKLQMIDPCPCPCPCPSRWMDGWMDGWACGDVITKQVAQAPNVRAQKVQALTELDSEIVNQLPTLPDGIDMSMLTAILTPAEKLLELDHPWDYETLFTSS